MTLQDRPNARGRDDDAHGGELTVDAAVAPGRVLLREAEHEGGGPLGDGRSTRPAVRVGPAPGDEVPVPAQQGRRLDDEVPETRAGEHPCERGQHRSICRLERRSVDVASEDRHLVAQHHDFNGEIDIAAPGEPVQLEGAAERPVEE